MPAQSSRGNPTTDAKNPRPVFLCSTRAIKLVIVSDSNLYRESKVESFIQIYINYGDFLPVSIK